MLKLNKKSSFKCDSRIAITIFFIWGSTWSASLIGLSTPSSKGVLKYMSEALISRRGKSGGGGGERLITELITYSTSYIVPNHTGNISVRIFGGGGGGYASYTSQPVVGGCGGWMNNGEFSIANGTTVPITIGIGGKRFISLQNYHINGSHGGTTSFGTYLSANGGSTYGIGGVLEGGSGGGSGGVGGGNAYQFGGGGSYANSGTGGNGGTYGGGGGGGNYGKGGDGGTYGGGGGGGGGYKYYDEGKWYLYMYNGGNGGTYGGGGGAGIFWYNYGSGIKGNMSARGGSGGTYGGNGGDSSKLQENGTNTSTWTNVDKVNNEYLRGNGTGGYQDQQILNIWYTYMSSDYSVFNGVLNCGGGGGYGGCGGNGYTYSGSRKLGQFVGNGTGGGGGYGGNGGDGQSTGSGGGGGYGGDGGSWGGGGGGYGKSATGGSYGGGGGGYFSRGGNHYGGGGGYGDGGTSESYSEFRKPGFGAGGGGGTATYGSSEVTVTCQDGGDGICIIQYYT